MKTKMNWRGQVICRKCGRYMDRVSPVTHNSDGTYGCPRCKNQENPEDIEGYQSE